MRIFLFSREQIRLVENRLKNIYKLHWYYIYDIVSNSKYMQNLCDKDTFMSLSFND